jgi:hypothetical protein
LSGANIPQVDHAVCPGSGDELSIGAKSDGVKWCAVAKADNNLIGLEQVLRI